MYQTAVHTSKEAALADRLVQKYGGCMYPSSPYDHYDRLWVVDGQKWFVEIKVRECSRSQYIDTPMDYAKVMFLASQPIPSMFVVEWTDSRGAVNLKDFYKTDFFKRKAGNRVGDHERLQAFYLNKDFGDPARLLRGE